MSIRIIKKGLLDTIQDYGRYGYQHLGINPNGVMDFISMRLANALTGNSEQEAVIEMHWPAPVIQFQHDTCFAITGASVIAHLDDTVLVENNKKNFAKAGSQLSFKKILSGARIYMTVHGGFDLQPWLKSNSTHVQLNYGGAILKSGDTLSYKYSSAYAVSANGSLPWHIQSPINLSDKIIHFTTGKEWLLIDESGRSRFQQSLYQIDQNSNRMGYRLHGEAVHLSVATELISTAVTKGTIQLLPNGQPLILMADHQTTGGYPRMGHVISADIPKLAQFAPGDTIQFKEISMTEAHNRLRALNLHLKQIEIACKLRMHDH